MCRLLAVPELSRSFGLVIQRYFDDHMPPHFHARQGASTGRIALQPLAPIDWDLPPRGSRLTPDWAMLHEQELLENWCWIRSGQPPAKIAPLE